MRLPLGIRLLLTGMIGFGACGCDSVKQVGQILLQTQADHLKQGEALLNQGNLVEAEAAFGLAIANESGSHELEDRIAKIYARKVAGLDYAALMASPVQALVYTHAEAAVEKYFQAHPYTQTLRFVPPLTSSFCIAQGEGGKSLHYGLLDHYSYDFVNCWSSFGQLLYDQSQYAMGLPIHAVADGTVVEAIDANADNALGAPVNLRAQVNLMTIDHGGGISSQYLHLKSGSITARRGATVTAGQQVAAMGNSGITTGPHLHFSLKNKDGISLPITFDRLNGATDTNRADLKEATLYTP